MQAGISSTIGCGAWTPSGPAACAKQLGDRPRDDHALAAALAALGPMPEGPARITPAAVPPPRLLGKR